MTNRNDVDETRRMDFQDLMFWVLVWCSIASVVTTLVVAKVAAEYERARWHTVCAAQCFPANTDTRALVLYRCLCAQPEPAPVAESW